MIADHLPVIHLVDMVAGQDQDHRRPIILDIIQILVDRVGRAAVPVGIFVILEGRQDGDAAVAADHVPGGAGADMVDQGIGTVLAEDGDPLDAGVQQIGQGEINDPGKAAEGDSGFGPVMSQHTQFIDAATGQDHCQGRGFVHRTPCRWSIGARTSGQGLP